MDLQSVTPAHLAAQVNSALGRGDPRKPAFTLIAGAGFSYGLVPLVRDMMRVEIGPWYQKELGTLSPACMSKLTADFWRRFNEENREYCPGCQVDLDGNGLPTNPTAAYQSVSKAEAIGGIATVEDARAFLRAMVAKSRGRLNAAHFFLAALLDAQRRGELYGTRPFCRTIFTTNFDALLQTSLQLMGVLYYMTDRPELSINAGHMVEDDDAIHLIYTHGSVHRPYLANTEAELQRLRDFNAPIFAPYLEEHGVIVVGYSGWDDSLVTALNKCTNFAANLYWCDVFPKQEALNRLSVYATDLLTNERGRCFYVPLGSEGADGLMGLLFQALVPNQGIPRLVIDPFVGLADQLSGLSLEGLTLKRYATSAAPHTSTPGAREVPAPEVLKVSAEELRAKAVDALRGASQRLRAAEGGVGSGGPDVIPHLFSTALDRFVADRIDEAIAIWDTVINLPGAPPDQVAKALFNRGFAYGQKGETEKAIADYTSTIDLPGAPPDQVAKSLLNRGFTYGQRGETDKEIADYTSTIDLRGAPPVQVAKALFNRGLTYGQKGETKKAIADYTSTIDLPGAPPDQVAKSLFNRGLTYGHKGETEKEIADYTSTIDLPDAPPDQVAKALFNRGFAYGQKGETEKAIADYTSTIDLPGAPPDQVAKAILNRGWTNYRGGDGDAAIFMADAEASARLNPSPGALSNLGIAYCFAGNDSSAIEAYRRFLESAPSVKEIEVARADLTAATGKWLDERRAAPILALLDSK